MDPYFFRVEHDLLRSEAFKDLGGSAIKVYLVIGLYSDFGTGWAYPSIRTIAKQAGLSRQTVLAAIDDLMRAGMLASSKSPGRSNAYRILRQGPDRTRKRGNKEPSQNRDRTSPTLLEDHRESSPTSLEGRSSTVPTFFEVSAQDFGPNGPDAGPKREPGTREDDNTGGIPIPGTPFRLSADGRLQVAVDLQELLKDQGIPPRLAEKLAARKTPEDVAKVLLNALYLQSQGKLQNRLGYIRAGLEDGYDLLPQVAHRLESRRREFHEQLKAVSTRREEERREAEHRDEEAAINLLIESLRTDDLQHLVDQAVASLPEPIVRRNPTLSNPFVRGKVYELAGGEPLA